MKRIYLYSQCLLCDMYCTNFLFTFKVLIRSSIMHLVLASCPSLTVMLPLDFLTLLRQLTRPTDFFPFLTGGYQRLGYANTMQEPDAKTNPSVHPCSCFLCVAASDAKCAYETGPSCVHWARCHTQRKCGQMYSMGRGPTRRRNEMSYKGFFLLILGCFNFTIFATIFSQLFPLNFLSDNNFNIPDRLVRAVEVM